MSISPIAKMGLAFVALVLGGCALVGTKACPPQASASKDEAFGKVKQFLNVDELSALTLELTGVSWNCAWIVSVAQSNGPVDSGLELIVDRMGNVRRMTEDDWNDFLGAEAR
ncbi:hypothetical protein [Pseudomarimonas arenosa]|uniref:Lipoprotein n=1 Tax=Pseudomarimonas arenosa TaxID=2774145 RepID=A0AAW3ZL13_9GAMM|nr:hypothetical protein [Pseudomarimonas arenosa]MBD8526145.1 hypothetical protein [Pseudomarimonas arenosa]